MKQLLFAVAWLVGIGALAYVFVLRYTASRIYLPDQPMANIVIGVAGLTVLGLYYADYWHSPVSGIPRPGQTPQPAAETPPPQSRRKSIFPAVLAPLLLLAMTYLRHTYHAERPLWFDAYWTVVLPVLLGASALFWIWDSFMAPLKTRLHLGRTPAAIRSVFVLKRILLFILAFAILLLIRPGDVPDIYAAAVPHALLSGIWASLLSIFVITR